MARRRNMFFLMTNAVSELVKVARGDTPSHGRIIRLVTQVSGCSQRPTVQVTISFAMLGITIESLVSDHNLLDTAQV